jgi:hypothetical protein
MAGPELEMMQEAMQEAMREMREVDLAARPQEAEKRASKQVAAALKKYVLNTHSQSANATEKLVTNMFHPLGDLLRAKYAQEIDEDLEELETLMMDAEEWRLVMTDEPSKPAAGPRKEDDPDSGGAGFAGGLGDLGLTTVVTRARHNWAWTVSEEEGVL